MQKQFSEGRLADEAICRIEEAKRTGRDVYRDAEIYWQVVTKQYPKSRRKQITKAVLQLLLKTYPELMDEAV
jgi:hypothetical protein